MRTTLFAGYKEVDQTVVKFGFRTLRADKDEGLFINDKKYIIKGVCCHENCGLTGKYVPDNIQRYRVQMLKEMGANGYRTSHYPQSEALMDALDENGFIVMNETRWFESTDEGKQQLETLIKRDRNRPGVVFWSLGNEEPHHCTEQGVRILRSLVPFARKLDPSDRFIMTAITHAAAICYDEVDVVGTNYLWKYIDEIHEKAAHKPFVSSECAASGTTRGWYYDDDPGRGFVRGYDHDINATFLSRENTWKAIMNRPWFMGGYQWTGFEYRGEAVWPRLASQSGAIDLYLQKKDAFYQNQSHWLETPMIHALPHWNFIGREGEIIDVWAYTNQGSAELFLNGESQGRREIEKWGHAEWKVPFEAGELKVVAYDEGGKIVAEDVKKTTGAPVALKLRLDTPELKVGDIAVVTCYVVDAEGNEVPDACPMVRFMGGGAAKIYSTGSSISDHLTIFSPERKMRAGRITVGVKIKDTGTCKVYAEADGLTTALLSFEVE
jgi:beta-galactosidase